MWLDTWAVEEAGRKKWWVRMNLVAARYVALSMGPGKVKAARRAPKIRMAEKPRRGPERSGGESNRSARRQLQLTRERTSDRIVRKTLASEIAKQMVRVREKNDSTFWKNRPPSKRKKT
jgi:hypothetical protein